MKLRDKILAANDVKSEKKYIEEWDCEIEIRGMSGAGRARVMASAVDDTGKVNMEKVYPELLVNTLRDPKSGDLIFGPEDKDALLSKSGAVIERLAQIASRLSGIGPEAQAEAEKN